jgi:hypothetical protein
VPVRKPYTPKGLPATTDLEKQLEPSKSEEKEQQAKEDASKKKEPKYLG